MVVEVLLQLIPRNQQRAMAEQGFEGGEGNQKD